MVIETIFDRSAIAPHRASRCSSSHSPQKEIGGRVLGTRARVWPE